MIDLPIRGTTGICKGHRTCYHGSSANQGTVHILGLNVDSSNINDAHQGAQQITKNSQLCRHVLADFVTPDDLARPPRKTRTRDRDGPVGVQSRLAMIEPRKQSRCGLLGMAGRPTAATPDGLTAWDVDFQTAAALLELS